MNCTDTEKMALEYLEGGLASDRAKAFEQHLHECERCNDYLLFVKTTLGQVELEKEVSPGISFLENVLEKVSPPALLKVKQRKLYQFAAAAAVIIFAVFTGINLGRYSSAGYISQGNPIENDILFAEDISMEPIESYFLINGGE